MNTVRQTCLLMLSAMVASVTTGCGDGASTKPTITAKPKEGGTIPVSNGGATTTNGGNAVVAGFGTFKGVITFEGEPPVMGLLNSQKDAICFANKDKVRDQSLIVNSENKGIKNVFVYLAKTPKGAKVAAAPDVPFDFDQKFCTFLAHASIVRTGQTIQIKSDDNTSHNTHISPLSPLNSGFNQIVKPGDRVGLSMSFKGAEKYPVTVKCDIHTWMTAFILPLKHDFAAVTDKDGKFEIKGLPAGDHKFVIWHEKAARLDGKFEVTIKADETDPPPITITYSADKFRK